MNEYLNKKAYEMNFIALSFPTKLLEKQFHRNAVLSYDKRKRNATGQPFNFLLVHL